MPLTRFNDHDLARRLEAAWAWTGLTSARAYSAARPGLGVRFEPLEGGGTATDFGPGSPLSQAQGLGLDGLAPEAALDRLDAFYAGSTASVEVASLADPTLLPRLAARGYRPAEQTHMLTLPLDGPGDAPTPPDGPEVARVEGPEALAALARVVLGGFFEGPEEPPEAIADVITALNAAPEASAWLARVNGNEPAGGATLLLHDGIALLAGDATLPRLRGLGAQTALILARLDAARAAGCDLAVACTNPGTSSQRNYERLGFRLAYARTLMVRRVN